MSRRDDDRARAEMLLHMRVLMQELINIIDAYKVISNKDTRKLLERQIQAWLQGISNAMAQYRQMLPKED